MLCTILVTTGVTTEQYRRAVRADEVIDFLCPPCESAVAAQSQQPRNDDSWGSGLQHSPQFESTRLSVSANADNSQRPVSIDISVDQHERTEEESTDSDVAQVAGVDDDTPTDVATSEVQDEEPVVEGQDVLEMLSNKGAAKISYAGYMYTKHSVRPNGDVRWRCVERRLKCHGIIHTDNGKASVRVISDHNHAVDQTSVEVTLCRNNMKTRATQSRDKPGVIYTEAVQGLSDGARATIASASIVKRSLRNCKTVHHPPQPATLTDPTVDGEWATTGGVDRKPFLIHDNGAQSQSRMVMFATEKGLELLSRSATWFMDGNFSMAPSLFMQVIIHKSLSACVARRYDFAR